MFQRLVSHNEDLRRLVERGYAVAFDSGYLIVRDIPYMDNNGHLQIGAIVAKLVFVDQDHVVQDDHQVFFAGGVPCNLDGTPIGNLGGGTTQLALSDKSKDVVVQRSFSNKPMPTGFFANFFEKVESYVRIISGPAMDRYDVTPFTFRTVETVNDSVFKFQDTLTSRAEILDLSTKFNNDNVAIIGLGGTGAYLLDFLVKMPVREIRAFDLDVFHVHNAYRSPGRLDPSELDQPKADIYQRRYENFRIGLSARPKFIDATSVEDLHGITFAFVCVDKGSSRAQVLEVLLSLGIPFIDVGMGLSRKDDGCLNGMVRATYFSATDGKKLRHKGLVELADNPDDLYRSNIQISELNALNACLAIIKFKQVRGFYFEEVPWFHLLLEIGDLKMVGESAL